MRGKYFTLLHVRYQPGNEAIMELCNPEGSSYDWISTVKEDYPELKVLPTVINETALKTLQSITGNSCNNGRFILYPNDIADGSCAQTKISELLYGGTLEQWDILFKKGLIIFNRLCITLDVDAPSYLYFASKEKYGSGPSARLTIFKSFLFGATQRIIQDIEELSHSLQKFCDKQNIALCLQCISYKTQYVPLSEKDVNMLRDYTSVNDIHWFPMIKYEPDLTNKDIQFVFNGRWVKSQLRQHVKYQEHSVKNIMHFIKVSSKKKIPRNKLISQSGYDITLSSGSHDIDISSDIKILVTGGSCSINITDSNPTLDIVGGCINVNVNSGEPKINHQGGKPNIFIRGGNPKLSLNGGNANVKYL